MGPGYRLAPQRLIALCLLIAVSGYCVAAYIIFKTPVLGVSLANTASGKGLAVASVDPVLQPEMQPGRIWLSAGGEGGDAIPLDRQAILPEPDVLSYRELPYFYDRQSQLARYMRDGALPVRLSTGEVTVLETYSGKHFRSLTAIFWSHAIYSLIAIALVSGVWAFRRRERAAQLLMLSGVGFYFLNFGPAIYANRELAIDGMTFQWLSWINHAGTVLNITSLSVLMWVYPQRLARLPVASAMFASAALTLLADVLRLGNGAAKTHYMPLLITFIFGVGFAVVQWRKSRREPLDRASLRWVVLAIFWATSTSIFLLVVPVVLGFDQVLPQHVGFAPLLIMYVGLIAGILRYRLFELEIWWVRSWIWAAGGVFIIVVDLVLVAVLGWSHPSSAMASLFIAGFIYFPLRQLAWDRLTSTSNNMIAKTISSMAGALVVVQDLCDLEESWAEQVRQTFQPLRTHELPDRVVAVNVGQAGTTLDVPRPSGRGTLRLEYPYLGGRLFNRRDLILAQAMADVGEQAAKTLTARRSGADEERKRIMRDMHDDLGAKLLTLIHSANNDEAKVIARSALADLRSIVAARDYQSIALPNLMLIIRQEFEQRVALADLTPAWRLEGEVPDRTMTGRWSANVSRIVREAVSNAIRHAQASRIYLLIRVETGHVVLRISDDGCGAGEGGWQAGRGMATMQHRAEESGFDLDVDLNQAQGARVELRCAL